MLEAEGAAHGGAQLATVTGHRVAAQLELLAREEAQRRGGAPAQVLQVGQREGAHERVRVRRLIAAHEALRRAALPQRLLRAVHVVLDLAQEPGALGRDRRDRGGCRAEKNSEHKLSGRGTGVCFTQAESEH